MTKTQLLLSAYYEALHDFLYQNRRRVKQIIESALNEEVKQRNFAAFDKQKFNAYRDAAIAFLDERIEAYNPIGLQYTFDKRTRYHTARLEEHITFYDSRNEFSALIDTAKNLALRHSTDDDLPKLASLLIEERGAFPNQSIIAAYEKRPALNKLPDYILAKAIEDSIKN